MADHADAAVVEGDRGEPGNPRLVVVSQHYPPDNSGNASRIRDTCQHLVSEGWEVTVLAPPPAFPHGQFDRTWRRRYVEKRDGMAVHRLWTWQPTGEDPGFGSRMAYYLLFPLHALLWLLFNYREYDLVITSSPPIFTGLAALPLGSMGWKPWVVDVRDLWIDASVALGFISEGGVLERLSRLYQRIVLQTADRVSATTKQLEKQIASTYDLPEEKLLHLPNGVDTEQFDVDVNVAGSRIVYTGNVGHAQDLETCLRALNRLDGTDAEMTIVGDGDVRTELEAASRELGIEEVVEFTGVLPREEIPDVLETAAIGVAPLKGTPTLEYAVPTKAYEYMAAATPVVATGQGEIERLVEESESGVVADNDPTDVAETFERLLTDADLRRELGENGREHIRAHYDRRSIAHQLSESLRGLISEHDADKVTH